MNNHKILQKVPMHIRRYFLKTTMIGLASILTVSYLKADESNTPFTFAQLCDPQLGFGGYEHDLKTFRQAVKQVNELNPDFVVICGDLVNTADEKSFADFNGIKSELAMPCYCVSGNHDVGNEPTAHSIANYEKAVTEDYYSFIHKGYTFVIVNTQLWKSPLQGETEAQDAWLKKTLENAAEQKSPVVVAGHYPIFLKTPDEEEEYMNLPLQTRQRLLALYEKNGVVAVLGGHTHRLLINDYKGIQLVNGEVTSRHFDERPLGFRLWHVDGPNSVKHEFVTLKDL